MAQRCSVCQAWIKTAGGTHNCPGAPPNPPKPNTRDEYLDVFNDDENKAPLLWIAALA